MKKAQRLCEEEDVLEFLPSQVASVYEKKELPKATNEQPATKEAEDQLEFDESGFDTRFGSKLSLDGNFDIKRE